MRQRRISLLATILVSAVVSAVTSAAMSGWSGRQDDEADTGVASETPREVLHAPETVADNAERTRGGATGPEAAEPRLVIATPRAQDDERLRRRLRITGSGFDLGSVLYVMGKEVGAANDEYDVLATVPRPGEWDVAVEVYSERGQLEMGKKARIIARVPNYELDRLLEVTEKARRSPLAVTLRDMRTVRDLLGEEAIDLIVEFARSPGGRLSVRRGALLLIIEVGQVRSVEALLPLIEEAPELRRTVEVVLDHICGNELPLQFQMYPPVTFGKTAANSFNEWNRWLGINRESLLELRSRFITKAP